MNEIKFMVMLALVMLDSTSYADTFGTGTNQFTIDFVEIGNVNNAPDSTGYGSVSFNYRIGKYEVTAAQWEKAWHESGHTISDGDESNWFRGLGDAAPVVNDRAYEAMKFVNWLTSGNALDGAYKFSSNGATLLAVDRDAALNAYGTVYVLPSEDEWYKAAYYKPVNNGSYSLYANGSDLETSLIQGTTNGWNYYNSVYVDSVNFMWPPGSGAKEQNGTYDMMGNVAEWIESAYDGNLDDLTENRVARGGNALNNYGIDTWLMSSRGRMSSPASTELGYLGLRVVAIESPLPDELRSISIEATSSNIVEISFECTFSANYQLQYSTNLTDNEWFSVGDQIIGDHATHSVTDIVGSSEYRYYRLSAGE
jgi:formylglycine-generating enzyme required for sulfatase activity